MSDQLMEQSQDQTTKSPSTSTSLSVNSNDSQPIFFQAIVHELSKSESHTADINGINVDHLFQIHCKNSHVKDISMKFLQDKICLDAKRRSFSLLAKSPYLKSIKYSDIDRVCIYSVDPCVLMFSIKINYEGENDSEQSKQLFTTYKCESISISRLVYKMITNVVNNEPERLLTMKIASETGCPILPSNLEYTASNSSFNDGSSQTVFFRTVVREISRSIMDKSEFKFQVGKDLCELMQIHGKKVHVGDIGMVYLEDHLCLEMNRQTESFHNVFVKYSDIIKLYKGKIWGELMGIAIEIEENKKVEVIDYRCKTASMAWFLLKLLKAVEQQEPRLLTREMAVDIGCPLLSPEGGELTKSNSHNEDQNIKTALFQTRVYEKEAIYIKDEITREKTIISTDLIKKQSPSPRVDNIEMSLFTDHIRFAMERGTESFHYHFVRYIDILRVQLVPDNEKEILLLVETNFRNRPKRVLWYGCQSESNSHMLFKLINSAISHEPSLLTEEIVLDAGCPASQSDKHKLDDDQREFNNLENGRRSKDDDLH